MRLSGGTAIPFVGNVDFIFGAWARPATRKKKAKKNFCALRNATYAGRCNLAQRLRVMRTTNSPMKTKTFLLFVSLVVLTTVARAAQPLTANDPVVLPAYTVETPRISPAEKQIAASLDELRQQAKAPMVMPVDCVALKAVVKQGSIIAQQAPVKKVVRLAKS